MQIPVVPGVVVERALAGRPAWRGHTGREPVDVTVLTLPPDPGLRRAALAALTPLVGPGSGPVPRCRAAVLCRDGVALLADAVDGRPLAELPPLLPGHAIAVGRPVARALAALHARGLSWGGRFEELLVDDGGRVRLPYDALAARRVEGPAGTARGDVTALARLLARRCVDPRVAALAAHPPEDATALSRRLRRIARPRPPVLLAPAADRGAPAAAPPGPVRASTAPSAPSDLPPAPPGRLPAPPGPVGAAPARPTVPATAARPPWPAASAPPIAAPTSARVRSAAPAAPTVTTGRLRPPRLVVLGGAGCLALVAAAALGWSSGRTPHPAGPTTAPLPTVAPDWTATVHGLDEARAAALTGTAPLTAADAVGSPALAADAATRAALVARRLHATAPVPALRTVAVRTATADRATVAVTDTLAGYAYRDAAGRVVATVPARGARTWTVVLTRSPGGWRIASVT